MSYNIFIDLDETLIASYIVSNPSNSVGERLKQKYEWYEHKCFITYLRPGAREFVNFCVSFFEKKHTFLLTYAISEYTYRIIKGLNIPHFNSTNIFTREDLHRSPPIYTKDTNILIDDKPYNLHLYSGKAPLIGLKGENLLQIDEFYPIANDIIEDTDPEFIRLQQLIKQNYGRKG